jgi:hypothetical protein
MEIVYKINGKNYVACFYDATGEIKRLKKNQALSFICYDEFYSIVFESVNGNDIEVECNYDEYGGYNHIDAIRAIEWTGIGDDFKEWEVEVIIKKIVITIE